MFATFNPLGQLSHWNNVRKAVKREKQKEKERSPQWATFRDAWLKEHPLCASCGSSEHPQVHHVIPFHVDPSKERDLGNVITMCMGPNECHLKIAHGGDFKAWDPNVRDHVKSLVHNPASRPTVELLAKRARMYA